MNKRILAFLTWFITLCVILIIGYMSGQNVSVVEYYVVAGIFIIIGSALMLHFWIMADQETVDEYENYSDKPEKVSLKIIK